MSKLTKRFSIYELLAVTLMAALGMAVKPVVHSLAQIITGPLAIPSGVLAGGIYMMFLVLAAGLTGRRFSATLAGLVQAIISLILGIGSHGIMNFLIYLMPGLAVDGSIWLFWLLQKDKTSTVPSAPACFCACMAANICGSFPVSVVVFDIPPIPLMLSLCTAALSGGLGGLLGRLIIKQIKRLDIIP